MAVETKTVQKITCDNPDCKGHPDLDPKERTGWFFVNSEFYGLPSQNHVFGSAECASAAATNKDADFGVPPEGLTPPPTVPELSAR